MDLQTSVARQQISSDQSTRVDAQRVDRGVVRIGKPDPTIDLSEVIAADGGVSRTGRKIFNTIATEGQVVRATQPNGSGIVALDEISVSSNGLRNKIFTTEEETFKKKKKEPIYTVSLVSAQMLQEGATSPNNTFSSVDHSGTFTKFDNQTPVSNSSFILGTRNVTLSYSPTPNQILGTSSFTFGCSQDWGIVFNIEASGLPNRQYDLITSEDSGSGFVDVLTTRIKIVPYSQAYIDALNRPNATIKNLGENTTENYAFNSIGIKTYCSDIIDINSPSNNLIRIGSGAYATDANFNYITPQASIPSPCPIVGNITLSYRFRLA